MFSEVHLSFTARQQDIIPCFVESECSFWRTSRSELILKRFFQTCQGYIIFDTEFSFLLCLEDDGSCRRNEEESLTCSQFSLSPVQAQFFFSVLKFRMLLLQASRVTQLHNFVFFFPPETFGSYQEPGLLSTSLSQLIAKCLNVEMRSWRKQIPLWPDDTQHQEVIPHIWCKIMQCNPCCSEYLLLRTLWAVKRQEGRRFK